MRDYGRLRIVQRTDPRGYDYYWFGLGPMVETPGHSTDLEAVADGYVSVTPAPPRPDPRALARGTSRTVRGHTRRRGRDLNRKFERMLTCRVRRAGPGAGGALVEEASQVDVELHELVSVTGVPAWNGEA